MPICYQKAPAHIAWRIIAITTAPKGRYWPRAAIRIVENHAYSIAAYWREAEPQLLASPIAAFGQQQTLGSIWNQHIEEFYV